jgi:hypothetical protein
MSFTLNFFNVADPEFYSRWQLDSDAIVVESILERSPDHSYFDWGLVRNQQIGIQGHIFYALSSILGFIDFELMRFISATLTALALAAVGTQILRTGNVSLSAIWLTVSLASPWLVAAAKNLYWVPWSWVLPMVIAGWIFFTKARIARILLHSILFLVFFIRFSAGYEFVSTIILMAAIFPLVLDRCEDKSLRATRPLRTTLDSPIAIAFTGSLAFIVTFLLHSALRLPGNLAGGAADIIHSDVLRRTYGNPANYDPIYSPSLEANPFYVVLRYLIDWETPILKIGISDLMDFSVGKFGLAFLIFLLSLTVFGRLLQEKKIPQGGFFLILAGAISIPVSWYVLAKAHSAGHTHINYLLWYPLSISLIANLVWINFRQIWNFSRTRAHK